MKIDLKVYDNFLDTEVFESMRNDILKNATYGFSTTVNGSKDVYFNHLAWKCYQSVDKSYLKSPLFDIILPLINKIDDIKALIRVKVNCYVGSEVAKKHKDHQDLPFSHFGGIFSLNTCIKYCILGCIGTIGPSIASLFSIYNPVFEPGLITSKSIGIIYSNL